MVGFYHTDLSAAYVKPTITDLFGKQCGTYAEKIANCYVKHIYQKCHITITASRIFKEKMLKLKVRSVQYVPLGVDLDLFNPAKREKNIRKRFCVNEDGYILIYMGRFDNKKRVEILIDAFNKLQADKRFSLVLIGEGPLKSHLQDYSSPDNSIFILPYLNDKERLAELLASSDIYVTAGPYETFGLSVLEAQASGLPVVGVRAGALIERVPESVGVLGKVDSAEEMAANIKQLSENGFREKGRNARKMLEVCFS